MDEHSFQKDYKLELERWNAHCPSLVASMFMAGMPDLIINTSKAYTYYTEMKFWRNKNPPQSCVDMYTLLKGPQIGVIRHTLWKRNILCPIVAQLEHQSDMCAVCYKELFKIYPWKMLAKAQALIENRDQFLELLK